MARYAADHKDATRRRMIETSGSRFKRDGFDGAGISALVADAGLTNGAFYGHFASKNDLIATVVAEEIAAQVAQVDALPTGLASVKAFVHTYLSPEHRDNPDQGCPSAALLDEIVRQDAATRAAYTEGTQALIAAIARHLAADRDSNSGTNSDPDPDPDLRDRSIGLVTLLVSSLQMARAVTDRDLSDQILASGQRNALLIASGSLLSTNDLTQEIS